MPPGAEPTGLRLVSYQVGFGDCFLLTVRSAGGDRHLLVDFGTTGLPPGFAREQAVHLQRVALDVEARVQGAPFAVVATHRHADHISGFATDARLPTSSGGQAVADRRTSGEIIRGLQPRVVLQPWTEDPDLPTDATGPAAARGVSDAGFRQLLASAGAVSGLARREGETLQAALRSAAYHAAIGRELGFLGENNLSNASAVKNLVEMGKAGKAVFACYGGASGLESFLPGVTTHVLGPPTIRQSAAVRRQRQTDPDEFWGLQARLHAWLRGQEAMLGSANVAATVRRTAHGHRSSDGPFPRAQVYDPAALPPGVRLFKRRALTARGEQLLELVRALDRVLNNTSLVLLLDVGPLRLLFPGDAQIENWSHALFGPDAERNRKLLAGVDLYKVGHHGSLNATPRSLWALFEKKGARKALRTVVSTLEDVHGSAEARTEVPRRTLVAELKAQSTYFTTQTMRRELCRQTEIDLTAKRPRWSAWKAE